MNALAQLRRFYTLHFWLIIVYLVLIVLALSAIRKGSGKSSRRRNGPVPRGSRTAGCL